MKRTRSFRLALALALLVNVAGSPMAWAHLFPHAQPSCHEQAAAGTASCCDAGGCHCAVPAPMVFGIEGPARVPHPRWSAPLDTSSMPARLIDDPLRPPIR